MRNQSYNDFWQGIHKSAKEKSFPLRVMFELTYRCNFYCQHCYVPQEYRKKRELKTKEVFLVLDQLAQIGCFYLGFTGGEPFMRKDILDILWYAKKKGFEIIIYTNGSLINKKIAKALKDLRPNKVDITIPAMSKFVFENITKAKGAHHKVFRAIRLLNKNGVNLGFKTCVLKKNESEIKKIHDFADSLGALHRLDDTLSPRLDGSKEPYKFRGQVLDNKRQRITKEDCSEIKKAPDHVSQIKNQESKTEDLFKCGVGLSQAAITPLGELKMCLMIGYPKYNILETSFKNSWHRLRELVNSIKLNEDYRCNRCEFQLYCKWCPARGWLYNEDFLSCDPENYNKAKRLQHTLLQK